MRYELNQGLKPLDATDSREIEELGKIKEDLGSMVEIIDLKTFLKQERKENHQLVLRGMENIDHCKVEMYRECVFGTLSIPDKAHLGKKDWCYGFLLTKNQLIFVGEKVTIAESLFRDLEDYQMITLEHPAQVLFAALERYLVDDVDFLDRYETELSSFEDQVVQKTVDYSTETENYLMMKRKELMRLNRYYKQLSEVAQFLTDCPTGIIAQEDQDLFHLLQGKLERLYSDVQELREYETQIKEMYQNKVEMRSNQVVQFLTVVTTVFMPLTLITGWYGMNFTNMPELQTPHGYAIIIIICVLVIAIEFFIFKKKKWL